jgi:hypothetical protein
MTTTRLSILIGFMAIPIRVKVYGIVYGQPLSVSTSRRRAWQEKVMARKKLSRNAPSPDEFRPLQTESLFPQHLFRGRVPIHWIQLLHRLPRCVEIEQNSVCAVRISVPSSVEIACKQVLAGGVPLRHELC